jgi:hypothetical protein
MENMSMIVWALLFIACSPECNADFAGVWADATGLATYKTEEACEADWQFLFANSHHLQGVKNTAQCIKIKLPIEDI